MAKEKAVELVRRSYFQLWKVCPQMVTELVKCQRPEVCDVVLKKIPFVFVQHDT